MRMHSLEAMAELATTGNPVMKEVLDKRGETSPNVLEVNSGFVYEAILRLLFIVATYKHLHQQLIPAFCMSARTGAASLIC